MQDKDTGGHGTDHGEPQPKPTDCSHTRIDEREGADDLNHAGDDPEPLADADLIENLDH